MAYDAFYWRDEIHRYKEDYNKWCESGRKIIKRYRDETRAGLITRSLNL